MTVQEILAPIENEMKLFEVRFHESMKSKVPLLDKITHYIIRRKGKQMRPMFLFLTAKMLGEINEKTYQSASLLELLHTATLVHDDEVDDDNEPAPKNIPTPNVRKEINTNTGHNEGQSWG